MKKYRIADLVLGVDLKYDRSLRQAEPYRTDDDATPDFTVKLSEKTYQAYRDVGYSNPETIEYVAMRFALQEKLLRYGGIVLHSSAVVYENRAYLFSANSGVGKSTHTQLWIELFGAENAYILNDDAPALRKIDGQWFAFGTPWSGSSPLNVDAKVPLQAIGFVERADKNVATQISPDEAMGTFMLQTMAPRDKDQLIGALDKIVELLSDVPLFRIECKPDLEAARVSYEATRDAVSYDQLNRRNFS